jgi:broad specificity phosphatase PhoE
MSRFRGSINVPLNEYGWVAAIKAGFALRNEPIRLIVHDYQQRTINTAKAIQLFHPDALLAQHDVYSQRLGWLEGEEVTKDSLAFMQHYIKNPYKIPGPGIRSEREPQSFGGWLNDWFWTFDQLKRHAEQNLCKTLIVTHNRNIQAILAREGDWINEEAFDVPGPKPCEIAHFGDYLSTIRHGDTDWGT